MSRAPPAHADLLRIAEHVVGGAELGEYLPLLEEELALRGDDRRAPQWRKADVAPDTEFRVAIIGAGMSGLLTAHRLDQAGVDVVILEKNADVGGTWFENPYPGCRVDNPNHNYSYSFAQRHDWPLHFSDPGRAPRLLPRLRARLRPARPHPLRDRGGDGHLGRRRRRRGRSSCATPDGAEDTLACRRS